ncbi:hypothetical protein ACFUMH_01075 [Cellulomonas sp. NPDC057328]|uniref:hypothetical protein n=1 Tax=Cellulomonas sp. NPDC057328 TaxID=3346101 RepID=UPI00363F7CAD
MAGVAGFVGLVAGGPFGATQPSPAAAWSGWAVAGAALGAPVAGLPALGFRVRPAAAVPIAVGIALAVAVAGYLVTMRHVV